MRIRYAGKVFQIRAHTDDDRKILINNKYITYNKDKDWFETKLFTVAKEFIEYSHNYETKNVLDNFMQKWKFSWATSPTSGFSVPANDGLRYFDYQLAGIEYMINNKAVLLADEPGTGKTIQIAGYLNCIPEAERVLIVCPSSLRLNWKRELDKWLVDKSRKVTLDPKDESAFAHIVSFSSVWRPNVFPFLDKRKYDVVAIDEAHNCKNEEAKRTIQSLHLAKKSPRKVLMTGTPLVNRPIELFPLLNCLDENRWANKFSFAYEYCAAHYEDIYMYDKQKGRAVKKSVLNMSGASNLPSLSEKLRSSVMIRRLKADVLPQLPHKRRQLIEIPLETKNCKNAVKEESNRWSELCDIYGYEECVRQIESCEGVAFTEMAEKRKEVALSKIPFCIEYLKNLLDGVDKVVVFAHHRVVVDALFDELKDFNPVKVVGGMSDKQKQESVDSFQENDSVHVFIGNIQAAGVGYTLTKSSTVVFVELAFVPGLMSQAEDRCVRIGSKADYVLIQHLILEKSLDKKLCTMLIAKQEIADEILN